MKTFCVLIAIAAAFFTGCASPSTDTSEAAQSTNTCYVCQYNNDLACVRIKVKDNTPRTEYAGKTYYFCSEDCLKAFEKKSAKYVVKP